MSDRSQQSLDSAVLYEAFKQSGIGYYSGVPDSVTGPFSHYLAVNAPAEHDIATNEGNAIGMAIGYHAATGKLPVVYMQNSGLNNALDPLTSLSDRAVYGVPLVLLVGWRGEPGTHDEPQHERQGAITLSLFKHLGISAVKLSSNPTRAKSQIARSSELAVDNGHPQALILRRGLLTPQEAPLGGSGASLAREEAIGLVLDGMDKEDAVISGIGKISRELFEYREREKQNHNHDLLVIGGMGHASSIALSAAIHSPDRKFYCLDGDGSLQMHMGALASIGARNPANLYHIVFSNGVHDSVGGHPLPNQHINLPEIALACGYRHAFTVQTPGELNVKLRDISRLAGPVLLEILVAPGARQDLGRPQIMPANNYAEFSGFIRNNG